MLTIRLTRVGKKNSPSYRVVVADKKRAVKRKFIEILGHYNPISKPKELKIEKERAIFWMNNGAKPSDTVNNLMCDLGILDKKSKVNKIYGKKHTKKAIKEGVDSKPEAIKTEDTEEVTAGKEEITEIETDTSNNSPEGKSEEKVETPETPEEETEGKTETTIVEENKETKEPTNKN